jgi:TM2 domain-containing membrane protein YozV
MNRDLRKYARQTNFRLVAGFLLVLFIVGDGLIYLFYGRNAALMGLVCLVAGLTPVILIIGVLWLIDWIARRNRE